MNRNSQNKLGFYAALSTTLLTAVTFAVAFFTPPLSGPWCKGGCFIYPYTDIVSRFPRDYAWMYLAILWIVSYLILMALIQGSAPEERRHLGIIGSFFAALGAGILISNYYVQLFVVQASLLRGEMEGIALLSQYNPHGIFIALENVGYSLMTFGYLFYAFVFQAIKGEKAIRWIFLCSFLFNLAALFGISWGLGFDQEYIYEIATISINWITLLAAGPFLAAYFYKRSK